MNSKHLFQVLFVFSFSGVFAQNKEIDENTIVFAPDSGGYATTRIPALVMSKHGVLLAFCEARANGTGDWADIDLLLRRSKDKGKTWEPAIVLAPREPGRPTANITPIVDTEGTIHLLYHRNYSTAYYIKSIDDGETWSTPKDITYAFDAFRPEYNWKVLAMGPGHAIQLRNGRFVVPVWLCEPNPKVPGGDHRPSAIATIYSDDFGKTWKRGDIVTNTTPEFKNPSEHVAVELADERVMLNIRSESKENRRLVAYSPDGATRWTKPVFDDELFEPICMASLIRISGKTKAEKNRILFVNPDSRNNPHRMGNNSGSFIRENLTAKLSYDEGETWPVQKVLDARKSGYSDLAVGSDGTIYCLYESNDGYTDLWRYKIVLKRFNLEWLTDGNDNLNKTNKKNTRKRLTNVK
jgi:sialidase-1